MLARTQSVAAVILLFTAAGLYLVYGAHRAAGRDNVGAADSSGRSLDQLLDDKDYAALSAQFAHARLTHLEREYFQGILDDRENRPAPARTALERVLPELKQSNSHRAARAERTLAYDNFLLGRYGEARDDLSDLINNYGHEFNAVEMHTLQNDRDTFQLFRGAAPQKITGAATYTIRSQRDPLTNDDVLVEVNGKSDWWIFDTGANITAITASTAKQMGLTISKAHASTQSGATGNEVPLQSTVVPEMHIGAAVVRNAAAIVMEDQALDIDLGKNGHVQIHGILGYPVMAAMGSFTFKNNGISVAAQGPTTPRSTALYAEELNLLVDATVDNRMLPFQFDTGNIGAELTARFVREFPGQFATLRTGKAQFGGAGGLRELPVYLLPELSLGIGDATAQFKNVVALNADRGVDPLDRLYGNLGQGLLRQFQSYTIDFSRMRLRVGKKVQ